jgi:hypothetical protein
MKIKLKTLVVTFDDNTPDDTVEEVRHLLMNYQGKGVFVVEDGTAVEDVPDTDKHDKGAKHGKKG